MRMIEGKIVAYDINLPMTKVKWAFSF